MVMKQLRRPRKSIMAAFPRGLRLSTFMLALVMLIPAGVVGGGGEGPVLVLEPPPRTFLTNSTGVTLQCAALGTPTPTITWVGAAGEPVQSQPGVREVLPNGSLWLGPVVPGSTRTTRTTYRCRATNPSGTVISRATTLTTDFGEGEGENDEDLDDSKGKEEENEGESESEK
ncbi:Down syndrome cell adhesion molecule-like protein Dscam2 [Penaeus japonicus]|uniref:Down syndrome cell adhesion molecule-like protein Dscam2 n=1 Tax=Penaeus japonicus TaxID=27405 RepID=UPI001C70D823|nr:Down syndrome cell adhesion molecule-like protein Dscam2 [Penaeus japonicus]